MFLLTRKLNICSHQTQEGTGSVRFVSVPDFSKTHRFGSVRFDSVRKKKYSRFDAVRLAFFERVVARFDSVRFRVRFRPAPDRIKRFGSVRFRSAGSVRFLIPSASSELKTPRTCCLFQFSSGTMLHAENATKT